MQPTLVNLEDRQKVALRELAAQKGTSLAAEVRLAVDRHLEGGAIAPEMVEALDVLSLQAQEDLAAMEKRLEQTVRKLDAVFEEVARLRRGGAQTRDVPVAREVVGR